MSVAGTAHLFVFGKDYHLGDLLWFTPVLAAYRRQVAPDYVLLACPDQPISRILEGHPLVDEMIYYREPGGLVAGVRVRFAGLVVHDLRPVPLALSVLHDWRRRRPWLYLHDLWLEERGQWLATFLHLERLRELRPILRLDEADRAPACTLPHPYVVLAPRTGQYAVPLLDTIWRRIKGWPEGHWERLAVSLAAAGYEPITLAAPGQAPIAGTRALAGLSLRQAAGVVEQAAALVSVESGLWYVAAALACPFVIVPWWLPHALDWPAPMGVPYRRIPRASASIAVVLDQVHEVLAEHVASPAQSAPWRP